MVKKSQATIDGNFQGTAAVAELAAVQLHGLGAALALKVTFVSDGGVWIWDRIDSIVRLAKLGDVPVHRDLVLCSFIGTSRRVEQALHPFQHLLLPLMDLRRCADPAEIACSV